MGLWRARRLSLLPHSCLLDFMLSQSHHHQVILSFHQLFLWLSAFVLFLLDLSRVAAFCIDQPFFWKDLTVALLLDSVPPLSLPRVGLK